MKQSEIVPIRKLKLPFQITGLRVYFQVKIPRRLSKVLRPRVFEAMGLFPETSSMGVEDP